MQLSREVLTELEIVRRSPVWQALSDLFLDTELQPDDYRHIAEVIRRADYSLAEAEAILRDEVAPVFVVNMLSVAGEWIPWSEDFVRDRIIKRLQKRWCRGMLTRALAQLPEAAANRCAARFVRTDWRKVRELLAEGSDVRL